MNSVASSDAFESVAMLSSLAVVVVMAGGAASGDLPAASA